MTLAEFIATAMIALRRNVLRSVLTTLGIIIGVGSVIVMSAIGSGASKQIEAQIASLGTNQLTIFPGSMNVGGRQGGAGSAPPLTEKDLRAIRENVTGLVAAAGSMNGSATVVVGNTNWQTQINGNSSEIQAVRDWPLTSGRFFDAVEAAAGRKVAVLGATVARELYGEADPVGTNVRLNNVPFEVIGVLSVKGQAGGRDQDDVIIVPLATARSRLVGRPCSIALAGSTRSRLCSCWARRALMLSAVSSYKAWATGAGPRWLLSPLTTIVRAICACSTVTVSPTRSSRAGLTLLAPTWTWPLLTSSVASERVLKKRAAHSHLSIRTLSMRAL